MWSQSVVDGILTVQSGSAPEERHRGFEEDIVPVPELHYLHLGSGQGIPRSTIV